MKLRLIVTILILSLFAVGCGAAQTAPTPTTGPTSTPSPEPTEEPLPSPEPTEAIASPEEASVKRYHIVPEESEATYQVQEEFFNRPVQFVSPVGRTNEIEGEFEIEFVGDHQIRLGENRFRVDLRTLTTDEPKRDNQIRRKWLESDTYPWAEFTATEIQDFPADAAEGEAVPFKIQGDLTIREITNPVTFDTVATLSGDQFTGTATTFLLMQSYGFEPPVILGVLSVSDGVTVTLNFTAVEE